MAESHVKVLQTEFRAELVLCGRAWMCVSLHMYGHPTVLEGANEYLARCCLDDTGESFIGIDKLEPSHMRELASKLFSRMQQLHAQLAETARVAA